MNRVGVCRGICAGISDSGYDSSTCCAFFNVTVTLTLEVRLNFHILNE
jgi:hypothetical protein